MVNSHYQTCCFSLYRNYPDDQTPPTRFNHRYNSDVTTRNRLRNRLRKLDESGKGEISMLICWSCEDFVNMCV